MVRAVFLSVALSILALAGSAIAQTGTVVPEGFRPPRPIAGLGEGLTGVWVGLERSAAASASSTSGIDLASRWETYLFLSDGTWTRRPPQEGLDHADIPALRARLPEFFGRYTLSGKSVRLETSNKIVSTYLWSGDELKPTAETTGSSLTRVDTGVGLLLVGTYARSDISTRDFPGVTLPVLILDANGRFVDRNAGVRTVFSGSTDAFNAAGQGRYFIANNSLYLLYDDNRKKMMAFAVLPHPGDEEGAPSWLLVGQRWMTRR